MKQIALIITLFLISSVFSQSQDFANTHLLDPYNPEYKDGEVIVKFRDETSLSMLKSASGAIQIGLSGLDKIFKECNVTEMVNLFPYKKRLKSVRKITIGGENREIPQLYNIYKLKISNTFDIKEVVKYLEAEPEVIFAEPNYYFYSQEIINSSKFKNQISSGKEKHTRSSYEKYQNSTAINDPLLNEQWYLPVVNAFSSWEVTKGDSTQIIAILDTGVDYLHPDLDDNIWTNWAEVNGVEGVDDDNNGFVDDIRGWDFVNNDNDPKDDNSHGTHVAGIAAAEQNNGIGITGIAPLARIMPVKLLQSSGRGNSTDLAAAVSYASENGATVINMSLGSYGESQLVKVALENAYAGTGDGKGSILVAAAGNDHLRSSLKNPCGTYPLAPHFPACYQWVLGVMADDAGPCVGFSNWDFDGQVGWSNNNYEVRSLGVKLYSTIPSGNYKILSGTSMASPIVSGAVALMRHNKPELSGEEIFATIIQSSLNTTIDISKCLNYELRADLRFIEYSIVDTLKGSDNDGMADAGETIELVFTIKNAGGQSDSAWVKIDFGEFEDPSGIKIIKDLGLIGSMSAYATFTNSNDPVIIEIDPSIVHNREIVFKYTVGDSVSIPDTGEFILKVQNGEELKGIISKNTILYPDKEYYVTDNLVVDVNTTLTLKPGVNLFVDDGKGINILGQINAIGKSDSIISIKSSNQNWSNFNINTGILRYVEISGLAGQFRGNYLLEKSLLHNNYLQLNSAYTGEIKYSTITENHITIFNGNGWRCNYSNIVRNVPFSNLYSSIVHVENGNMQMSNCNITGNRQYSFYHQGYSENIARFVNPNYFGTDRKDLVGEYFFDYFDNPERGIIIADTIFHDAVDKTPGMVYDVILNGKRINHLENISDHDIPAIGDEHCKFDVYFNRPMDISIAPLLTFGVREPYTQHIVADNGSWNVDSTIFTAYYTITPKTGDGIQQVRVAGARDKENFEIPIEDSRFNFELKAAKLASQTFQATPGIGKVDLIWPSAKTEDILGYNIYRFINLTDSTYSDTLLINTELVLDTLFQDTNVIPDTTYHYLYKITGTDMLETDFSKSVTAIPFNAANGDANGDMAINVSDIVSVINYILENNPRPFLIDAADVNYDSLINVLDIVGLVNIILSPSQQSTLSLTNSTAEISVVNGIIYVDTPIELGGIQFTLENINSEQEVEILDALSGFEVVRKLKNGKLIIIAYSLSGKTINIGKIPLFKICNQNVRMVESILSNIHGGNISNSLTGYPTIYTPLNLNAGFELGQNYPNPFSGKTIIPFRLNIVADKVILSIYDIMGKEIKNWQFIHPSQGSHNVEWDSNGGNGIYIYKMQISQNGRCSYIQTKRMLIHH